MSPRALVPAALVALLALTVAPTDAEWLNEVRQEFCAEKSRKHPRSKTLIFRVPRDAPSGAEVCFTYAHRRDDQPNKGAVKVVALLVRETSPTGPILLIDEIDFGKVKIRETTAFGCAFTPGLEAGDVAMFEFKFIRPPRLIVRGKPGLEATFQFSGGVDFRD